MDDMTKYILGLQTQASSSLVGAMDTDPEDAAEAVRLGKSTGDDPSLISVDLDNYKRQHKTLLVSDLLRINGHLRDYINSNPMAAKISHDDMWALDDLSKTLDKIPVYGAVDQALKDFREGAQFQKGIIPGATYIPGLAVGAKPEEVAEVAKLEGIDRWAVATATILGYVPETAFRFLGGATHAATGLLARQAKAMGVDPDTVDKMREQGESVLADPGLQATMASIGIPFYMGGLREVGKFNRELREATGVKSWLDARKPPPPMVSKIFDDHYIEETKEGMKALDEAVAQAKKTPTVDMSPEMGMNFVRLKRGEVELGIPAEMVRKLYGDKLPEPDDGLLGWVKGLAEQMKAAEAVDGDINIPLADYLAKIDPEVHKTIHDDIRLRSDALTLNEAEWLGEWWKSREAAKEAEVRGVVEAAPKPFDPVGDAITQVRKAAGFEGFPREEPPMGGFSLPEAGKEVRIQTPDGKGAKVTAIGHSTAKQALTEIALHRLELPAEGLLTSHLKMIRDRLLKRAGDIRINIIKEADWKAAGGLGSDAHYSPVYDDINIRESAYNGNPKYVAYIVLHESLHGGTSRAIIAEPKFRGQIRDVMNDVLAQAPELGKQYGFKDEHEFITEALSNPDFQRALIKIRVDPTVAKSLGIEEWRKATAWDVLVHYIRHLYNLPKDAVTALEAVLKLTEEGFEKVIPPSEIAVYEQMKQGMEKTAVQYAGREVRPAGPEMPFEEGKLIGLTKKQSQKLMELIAKRNEEDKLAQEQRAIKAETKRQTKEWRDLAKQMRKEIKDDFENRPDIAVTNFFKEGILFGQKLKRKPKINPSFLTEEQIAALPKDFVSRYGFNPDDIAGNFGYLTGDEMVAKLIDVNKAASESGLSFDRFVTKLIDNETTRRMEYRYGKLAENILEEAQDHILGTTQMDLLHEQTMAMAQKAGIEPSLPDGRPFTKENVKAFVAKAFGDSKVGAYTVDKYLRFAGKSGAMAELLADKPVEAFKAQQQQYYQAAMAREASKFAKEQKKLDRLFKRYRKREVDGTDPAYADFIQDILFKIGEEPNRPLSDLQRAILKRGEGTTLAEFRDKELRMWGVDLPIPDFLEDQSLLQNPKTIKSMSVAEWRAVRDAITAMDKEGRGQMKVKIEGEEEQFRDWVGSTVKGWEDLPKVGEGVIPEPFLKELTKTYFNALITAESTLNRLDRGDSTGPLHKAIIYPMAEAANGESKLLKDTQKHIWEAAKDLKKPYLKKKVRNDLWVDPRDGRLLDFNRGNVLGILQNVGNVENLEKLAGGYGLEPQQVLDWLWKNVTKEDVLRAQRIGGVFKPLFKLADDMYMRMTGVPLKEIEIGTIQTPWGEMDGWYNPIAYDRYRANIAKDGDLMEPGYIGAMLANSYTKQRTGFIDVMELNLDVVPTRLRQMIHDISFRETVKQTNRIFKDREFKNALINAVGEKRYDSLEGWLKYVANKDSFPSEIHSFGAQALGKILQNTIAVLIGFNPYTVTKHGLTAAVNSITQGGPFTKHLMGVVYGRKDFDATMTNWQFALMKSEELQRRLRNWSDLIKGGPDISLINASWRDFMINAGATPVSLGDMLSSVPTWLANYERSLKKGSTEGQAIAEANAAVRQAHGSSVITNRPAIMQMRNPIGHSFATLYGFFSHMFQKQYEMAWRAKDTYTKMKEGDLAEARKQAPHLIKGLVSYIIVPAIVEDMFMGHPDSDHESWAEWAGMALLDDLSGSLIGVRDIAKGLVFGKPPDAGLFSETFKDLYQFAQDIRHPQKSFDRTHAAKSVADTVTLIGILSGLTNKQEGKIAQFIIRYNQGLEHPDGIGIAHALAPEWFKRATGIKTRPGWLTGLKRGTVKPPQRRAS